MFTREVLLTPLPRPPLSKEVPAPGVGRSRLGADCSTRVGRCPVGLVGGTVTWSANDRGRDHRRPRQEEARPNWRDLYTLPNVAAALCLLAQPFVESKVATVLLVS